MKKLQLDDMCIIVENENAEKYKAMGYIEIEFNESEIQSLPPIQKLED